MPKPNWDTDKFQSVQKEPNGDPVHDEEGNPVTVNNTSKMIEDYATGGEGKLIIGSISDPRIFFDKNGFLHIVLKGDEWDGKVKKHRLPKAGEEPHNDSKGYADGDGIYIHVSNSDPIDKVCPCKLNPNAICGCVQ